MRLKGILSISASLLLTMLPTACSTDDCEDNQNSLPLAGFYDGSAPDEAIAIDSVQIIGYHVPGGASALAGTATGTSQVFLPFRVDSDTTTYLLFYRQAELQKLGLSDTVTFIYERDPFFVSKACGAIYRYVIRDITTTHTFLDSVTCPPGVIDNKPIENLKFYFRVAHQENNE